MVIDPKTGQTHGLTHDLGQEFARRLAVGVEYVTFPRIADVVDASRTAVSISRSPMQHPRVGRTSISARR